MCLQAAPRCPGPKVAVLGFDVEVGWVFRTRWGDGLAGRSAFLCGGLRIAARSDVGFRAVSRTDLVGHRVFRARIADLHPGPGPARARLFGQTSMEVGFSARGARLCIQVKAQTPHRLPKRPLWKVGAAALVRQPACMPSPFVAAKRFLTLRARSPGLRARRIFWPARGGRG